MEKGVKKNRRKIIVIILAVLVILVGGYLIHNQFFSEDSSLDYAFDFNSLGLKSMNDTSKEIKQKTDGNVFNEIKLNPFENES